MLSLTLFCETAFTVHLKSMTSNKGYFWVYYSI